MRRTAAGVLAGALALSGVVATALPANAAAGFGLERIAGDNRYETSARIAAEFGATSGAILASGETGHVVDALSANFLAGVRQQPVLLTTRDSIPASVMARLNALTGAKTVTIVGGTAAVSTAVETSLRSMGFTVDRLSGDDRFATSEAIIKAGAASASTTGLVASGTSFPDALAGGPLAYKGKHPVFLTSGGGLPQDTIDALVAAGTRQVIILGGTSAVPASVEAALAARGITVVERLGGAGRSETSRLIADYLITNHMFSNTTFNVASGTPRGEGADALSGAALSGKENRVLLITDNTTSAAPVVAFANDRAATLSEVGHIFGGSAAVSVELETAIEAAGAAGGATVTTTSANVEAGQNITGAITGENIQSVTVSGLCIDGTVTLTDTDANTAGMQFSLGTLANATSGTCTLTFTTTFTGGATQTDTVDVTVTRPVSATVRPELVSASIVGTTTTTQATPTNPAGTTVSYTFDEAIIGGTAAPRGAAFNIYNNAGAQIDTDANTTVVSVDGRTVMVRFTNVTTVEGAAVLTLATVGVNAVTDQQGFINPIGDAAVGTAGGGDTTLAAGITDGPDLMNVGGFRQAATAGTTAVDFTFDEAAFTTATAGFRLVLAENPAGATGNEITCTGPGATDTTAGGGTVAGGSGTTTITVTCTNPTDPNTGVASTTPIAAAQVARGTVDAGTVRDNDTVNNTSVLQAADVSNNGNTFEPDLVSVSFQPGATATDVDRAVFVFDAEVAGGTLTTAGNFRVYSDEGTEVVGLTGNVNPQNRTQVLVEFSNGNATTPAPSTTAVDRAVGGSVTDGAVATAATATTVALANEQDEVGVANTLAGTVQTPGRTQGPDLTAVSMAQGEATTDQFGNVTPGTYQATYTFDEDVALPANVAAIAEFSLYQADGTRLVATTVSTATRTEDNDNTVTITGFFVDANNNGVQDGTEATATSAEIGNAVLGTADNGAVTEEVGSLVNPEGAEFTTGGTGTRTA